MSATSGVSALAPFRVRSFRFQWPADLATSWAMEMETIILAWYVLVETRSVLMLTVYASLAYIGTLLSPMFGVMGDRLGHRNLLCAMRGLYAALATTLMVLVFTGVLTPLLVMLIATLMGLVRPSDIGMRNALIGATMPSAQLMGAMSVQRVTQDSARVVGALSGAGLVAALGMGWAYVVVSSLYAAALFLTFKAGRERTAAPGSEPASAKAAPKAERPSPWRDLKEGARYVWDTPVLRAVMVLALVLNATAFPLFNWLLPVVAKEVYLGDQKLLGMLVASGAFGGLVGSIVMSKIGSGLRPARMMISGCAAWYLALLVFAHMPQPGLGMLMLFVAGLAQASGLIPQAAVLLRCSEPQFRGRVWGIRMLALYSNLPGLLIAGPLIGSFGYPALASLYCVLGLSCTVLVASRWRSELWTRSAPANRR